MFTEDLALFFSDFAVMAVFEGETGQVLFDASDSIVGGGRVISEDCRITYQTGKFPRLALESRIRIDGGTARPDITGTYELSEDPMKIEDGRMTMAPVTKVAA